jgi:tRNA-dihydrouridine synthase
MSKVAAHWELMPEVVKLVREMTGPLTDGGTILLGNGDVQNVTQGKELAKSTGCNGVMIGRGVFGTPWLFDEAGWTRGKTVEERLNILVEHTKLYEELLGDIKSFAIMKKHYKAYVNGFDGAKEFRMELMDCANASEVEEKVKGFLIAK